MNEIEKLQQEIKTLELLLQSKRETLQELRKSTGDLTQDSSAEDKIRLYKSLFRGREDVYAKRFESLKTKKTGYQPVCSQEWKPVICKKPQIKCRDCPNRDFLPVTNEVISSHLKGVMKSFTGKYQQQTFVMGLYPLLEDETCYFLALDFDKKDWKEDTTAFLHACVEKRIPAYLERSRSGNGGHVWIFFEEAIPALLARKLGTSLLTASLDKRPEIGLDSFDRFFPNQDTMQKGGFGNLIALPLQRKARDSDNSVFIDRSFTPYNDQWAFLFQVKKIHKKTVENYITESEYNHGILPVNFEDEKAPLPWERKEQFRFPEVSTPLPETISIIIADQVYVDSKVIPPVMRNRILRLASFLNPAFYQAQAQRLPTWNKPRILYCYEQHDSYISLPIGCLEDLKDFFLHYSIALEIKDKRSRGMEIDANFQGELKDEQKKAAKALLKENTGVLSATTAFGKTVIALWLIAQRKINTLVLVHRKQLQDQWKERAEQFLDIPAKDIGRFGGGRKKRSGIIDIVMIQSIVKKGEITVDWLREYGQVIVDECHHISSVSFEQAIKKCPAYYKTGLSATLIRKDGQHPIIFMNLGKIRYRVNARKQASLRGFSHSVIPCFTDFTVDFAENASQQIQELFKRVSVDEGRNNFIISKVLESIVERKKILIITERKDHLFDLSHRLDIENKFELYGGMRKKQISLLMEKIHAVPAEEGMVILSTGKYLGEGFDLPALDTLYLTLPLSWKGTLTQYAGRLHRDYHNKKEVRIYDFVDDKVPVLRQMYQKRMKGYNSLGYTICEPDKQNKLGNIKI